MKKNKDGVFEEDPIHGWFELSYAQYLTVPRLALQSMPLEWQKKFTALLEELDESLDWRPEEGRYWVQLRDGQGRYQKDPLADYRRGAELSLKEKPEPIIAKTLIVHTNDTAAYVALEYPYDLVVKDLACESFLAPWNVYVEEEQYDQERTLRLDNPKYELENPEAVRYFRSQITDPAEWKNWILVKIKL